MTTVLRPAAGTLPTTPRLVSYQTAYDGLGGQCDPSYTLQGGNSSYSTAQDEEQIILGYVASGDTVIVPDYEGENLDWAAGQESGENTLDAIRATEQALGAAASTPVAMVGYSGGSIATDFAAELAPSYAPELHFAATAMGGVPVDFLHNLAYINGSPGWSGIIPAVFVSLSRAFNLDLGQYLSPYGAQLTSQDAHGCINDFFGTHPGLKYQQLFKPQYQDINADGAFVAITDKLIMGRTGTPRGPLMIGVGNADGTGDGVMIAADDQQLAHQYCTEGVPVQFSVYSGDDHTNAAVPFEAAAKSFIDQSLSGAPASNGCASIAAGNSLAPQPLPPSAAPTPKVKAKPRLRFAVLGARRHGRAVLIRLRASTGALRGLTVTVRRGRRTVAHTRIAHVGTRARRLLVPAGRRLRRGRYVVRVTQGRRTLAVSRLRVR